MLEIRNLDASYGSIQAIRNIELTVNKGRTLCLLGGNGAGKTTLLKAIIGSSDLTINGTLMFEGRMINRLATQQIIAAGIALVPEGRQLFGDLTISENLLMGAYLRQDRAEIQRGVDLVYTIFPKLKTRRTQLARTLSGGEQQMVAIGRAVLSKPRLMLLDEPSLGLAPILVTEIMNLVRQVGSTGVTIVLVEQNARQALRISDDVCLINRGSVAFSGTVSDFRNDQRLLSSYFGTQPE
jgi:branched-chain amino acid transport system ATP-binding protein